MTLTLRSRLKPLRTRLLLLMAVVGPGIITANVDNDAGGITTYSVAGAHFGYGLMWMLPPRRRSPVRRAGLRPEQVRIAAAIVESSRTRTSG